MPVIPGGLRASHQTHAHAAKPLTEFKVFPAIELEGGVEQSRFLQHRLIDGHIAGGEIGPREIAEFVGFALG